MNVEQMRSALADFAHFLGAGRRADALEALAKLFEGLGPLKVGKIVSTIEGNWNSANRAPCHPAELRNVLDELQRAFARSGAKVQAQAFTALLRLFRGVDKQSLRPLSRKQLHPG